MQTDAGPRPAHCSQTRYFVLTILNVERNPSSSVEVFSGWLPVTAEVPGSNLSIERLYAYIVSRPRTRNPRINQNLVINQVTTHTRQTFVLTAITDNASDTGVLCLFSDHDMMGI